MLQNYVVSEVVPWLLLYGLVFFCQEKGIWMGVHTPTPSNSDQWGVLG